MIIKRRAKSRISEFMLLKLAVRLARRASYSLGSMIRVMAD